VVSDVDGKNRTTGLITGSTLNFYDVQMNRELQQIRSVFAEAEAKALEHENVYVTL